MHRLTTFFATLTVLAAAPSIHHGHANIVGPTDDRGTLIELGPKLGLSADEIEQARRSTGHIVCPVSKFDNGGQASAALVLSNQTIVTVAHVFVKGEKQWRELSECFFRPQSPPFETIKIDPTNIAVGTTSPFTAAQFPKDWAVVRLSAPIEGAKPYRFLPLKISARKDGIRFILISAGARDVKSDPKVPIVQECKFRKTSFKPPNLFFQSDCDTSFGMSGSVTLVRNDNELFVAAISQSSGPPSANYKAFKYMPGPDGSFANHLELREDFLRALVRLAKPVHESRAQPAAR
jgi:hypothetical protein